MKIFKTLDQAKEQRQLLDDYISLIESYNPETLEQHAIYYYAIEGNIQRTAHILNSLSFHIDLQEITASDIANIISSRAPSDDSLHKIIRTLYLKKTISNRRKPYYYD